MMTNEKEIPAVLQEALARMGLDSSALADGIQENPSAIDAETLNLFVVYSKIHAIAERIGASVCSVGGKTQTLLPPVTGYELI